MPKPQTDEEEPQGDEPSVPQADLQEDLPQLSVFESVLPPLPQQNTAPENDSVPLTIDGSSGNYESSGTVYLRNETDYAIDAPALLRKASPVKLSGDAVQVLIMHTHGTEAYTPDAQHSYTPTDTDRTTDKNYNMLRVGQEIADILQARGIKTVHSETLNDYPAYSGSYNRALADISDYMKQYPSVKVVIDVHRDAMIAADGTRYKTVADINGKRAAQLMFVTGTDAGGLSHDRWQDNLTFQLQLHQRLNSRYPGIMRPMNIRTGRFNQHVTTGSMLLEVGTSGNSLSEALYSAQLFAHTLADLLLGK